MILFEETRTKTFSCTALLSPHGGAFSRIGRFGKNSIVVQNTLFAPIPSPTTLPCYSALLFCTTLANSSLSKHPSVHTAASRPEPISFNAALILALLDFTTLIYTVDRRTVCCHCTAAPASPHPRRPLLRPLSRHCSLLRRRVPLLHCLSPCSVVALSLAILFAATLQVIFFFAIDHHHAVTLSHSALFQTAHVQLVLFQFKSIFIGLL